MACSPLATQTQFATTTSTSLETSFSDSLQTLPGSQTEVITTECISTIRGLCAVTTDFTATITLPGDVTTIQVPFIITHIVTDTEPTLTLFASCDSSSQVSSTSTPLTSPSPSQSPNSASAANSDTSLPAITQPPVSPSNPPDVLTTSTPPPTVLTEQTSTTLDNGSVVVLFTTITSSLPPTAVHVSKTHDPQPAPSTNESSTSQGSSSNLPPILAGVIPGFFGLFGIVGLIWYIIGRRKRYGDFEEEEVVPYPVTRVKDRHRQLDLDEPKPYEYGLVGHANSVATSASPPTTPAASSNLNHLRHEQRDSITPLMLSEAHLTGNTTPDLLGSGSSSPSLVMMQRMRTDSRPASILTTATNERRASRASLGQLNVTLPQSSASDYFGFVSEGGVEGHGIPRSPMERRELQVINAPLSPTSTVLSLNDSQRLGQSFPGAGPSTFTPPPRPNKSSRHAHRVSQTDVIVRRDGGRLPDDHVSVTSPYSQTGGSPSPVVRNQELSPPEYRE